MPFSGTITALITPFKEGALDEEGLRKNIRFQIASGIDALLLLGTTGEGTALSSQERARVIEISAEEKQVPILVNVGEVSTDQTLERVRQAEALGADGLLVIAPYYVFPSQEGLALHFEKVAQATSLPILLYHHPKRTGVEFSMELLVRLANQKNIIGMKEASGSIPYAANLRHVLPDFLLFAGDDLLSLPLLSIGATGLISVLSNLLPNEMGKLVKDREAFLYRELFPLMRGAFIETNPVPIKAMMELMDLPAGDPRLPLAKLSPDNHRAIQTLLSTLSLTGFEA